MQRTISIDAHRRHARLGRLQRLSPMGVDTEVHDMANRSPTDPVQAGVPSEKSAMVDALTDLPYRGSWNWLTVWS